MIETVGLTKKFPADRMGSYGASWDIYLDGIKNLIKDAVGKYDDIIALDGLNLEIKDGEFFGLLGPNGAGKSTLVKVLATLLIPDAGYATVNGFNVTAERDKAKASVSVVVSQGMRGFDQTLSARHNLEFFASLYNIRGLDAKAQIERTLKIMDILDVADRRLMTLSSGQKQRIAVARGLIVDAPVFLLDEPTIKLDPRCAADTRSFVKEILNKDQEKTILWCTHMLSEAESLCDRIAIMSNGKEVTCGSIRELTRLVCDQDVIEIEVSRATNRMSERLDRVATRKRQTILSQELKRVLFRLHVEDSGDALPQVIHAVEKEGGRVMSVEQPKPSLEDVYLALT